MTKYDNPFISAFNIDLFLREKNKLSPFKAISQEIKK